jgi:hypothetical protein
MGRWLLQVHYCAQGLGIIADDGGSAVPARIEPI